MYSGYKYALRRITSKGRDLPARTRQTIKEFHQRCRAINIDRSKTYNMDEIAIELDAPCKLYLNYKYFFTTTKMTIVPKLIYFCTHSSLYTCNFLKVMKEAYVQRVLAPHVHRCNQKDAQLYLDQAPPHKPLCVKNKFSENCVRLHFIPARLTSLLQPADVGWFHCVRNEYRIRWTKQGKKWYIESARAWTKQGNLKSPGYARVRIKMFELFVSSNIYFTHFCLFQSHTKAIEWLSEIWREFQANNCNLQLY